MTPPLDLDALAREACHVHHDDPSAPMPNWSCNCARILSALRKAEEQAKAAERERCVRIVCQWCAGGEMENAVVLPVNERGRHLGTWTRGSGAFDLGCAAAAIRRGDAE